MKEFKTRTLGIICILLWCTLPPLNAQQTYKNLVFEGAGIRGIAYSGAIKQLEVHGVMDGIEKVGGTSAGAITALLIAIGYTAEEAYELIGATKFQKFNDGRFFFLGGIHRMRKRYGWYRGAKFERWLEAAIEVKTGDADLTFTDLRNQGFKDLYVTALCVNQQKVFVFSAATYPDMKVKDAVRISMSIPLYFEANFIDEHGKVYRNPDERAGLDVVIDGGLLANFPITIFDEITVDAEGTAHRAPNPQTLGFRIDSAAQIEQDEQGNGLAEAVITDVQSYVAALYVMTLENLNRSELTAADWARTISVSAVGVGPKIRRLKEWEKRSLMESGERAVVGFWAKG